MQTGQSRHMQLELRIVWHYQRWIHFSLVYTRIGRPDFVNHVTGGPFIVNHQARPSNVYYREVKNKGHTSSMNQKTHFSIP